MQDHERWIVQLPDADRQFIEQIAKLDNYPKHLAKFASVMRERYKKSDKVKLASEIAIQAWQLAADDIEVRRATDWAIAKQVPRWHFLLVQDKPRNTVYRKALEKYIVPGKSVVFEIGTGSGILALMAARAGAKHVYTCEMHGLVAEAARRNIIRNGFEDQITVIQKPSYEIKLGDELPDAPDIFVAEIIDNYLLGEEVLPIMEDCWQRLFKPETIVLPRAIAAEGAIIGGDFWCNKARMAQVDGFDLSEFNQLAPLVSTLDLEDKSIAHALSDRKTLLYFDLSNRKTYPESSQEVSFHSKETGIVEGVLRWLSLDFGEGIHFDNCPPKRSAWCPMVHFFDKPVHARLDDKISIIVSHDRERIMIDRII